MPTYVILVPVRRDVDSTTHPALVRTQPSCNPVFEDQQTTDPDYT